MNKHLIITSRKENLNEIELFLTDFFDHLGLKKDIFFNVLLSLSELVNNSISHGNKFDEEKKVLISCSWKNSVLTLAVEDEGNGFEIEKIKDPTLPENIINERGRGLFLIKKLSDEFILKERGRLIEIKFEVEREY